MDSVFFFILLLILILCIVIVLNRKTIQRFISDSLVDCSFEKAPGVSLSFGVHNDEDGRERMLLKTIIDINKSDILDQVLASKEMRMIILKGYHTNNQQIENIVEIVLENSDPLCDHIESANELIRLLPESESDSNSEEESRITKLVIDETIEVTSGSESFNHIYEIKNSDKYFMINNNFLKLLNKFSLKLEIKLVKDEDSLLYNYTFTESNGDEISNNLRHYLLSYLHNLNEFVELEQLDLTEDSKLNRSFMRLGYDDQENPSDFDQTKIEAKFADFFKTPGYYSLVDYLLQYKMGDKLVEDIIHINHNDVKIIPNDLKEILNHLKGEVSCAENNHIIDKYYCEGECPTNERMEEGVTGKIKKIEEIHDLIKKNLNLSSNSPRARYKNTYVFYFFKFVLLNTFGEYSMDYLYRSIFNVTIDPSKIIYEDGGEIIRYQEDGSEKTINAEDTAEILKKLEDLQEFFNKTFLFKLDELNTYSYLKKLKTFPKVEDVNGFKIKRNTDYIMFGVVDEINLQNTYNLWMEERVFIKRINGVKEDIRIQDNEDIYFICNSGNNDMGYPVNSDDIGNGKYLLVINQEMCESNNEMFVCDSYDRCSSFQDKLASIAYFGAGCYYMTPDEQINILEKKLNQISELNTDIDSIDCYILDHIQNNLSYSSSFLDSLGSINQYKNKVNEFKRKLGEKLNPILEIALDDCKQEDEEKTKFFCRYPNIVEYVNLVLEEDEQIKCDTFTGSIEHFSSCQKANPSHVLGVIPQPGQDIKISCTFLKDQRFCLDGNITSEYASIQKKIDDAGEKYAVFVPGANIPKNICDVCGCGVDEDEDEDENEDNSTPAPTPTESSNNNSSNNNSSNNNSSNNNTTPSPTDSSNNSSNNNSSNNNTAPSPTDSSNNSSNNNSSNNNSSNNNKEEKKSCAKASPSHVLGVIPQQRGNIKVSCTFLKDQRFCADGSITPKYASIQKKIDDAGSRYAVFVPGANIPKNICDVCGCGDEEEINNSSNNLVTKITPSPSPAVSELVETVFDPSFPVIIFGNCGTAEKCKYAKADASSNSNWFGYLSLNTQNTRTGPPNDPYISANGTKIYLNTTHFIKVSKNVSVDFFDIDMNLMGRIVGNDRIMEFTKNDYIVVKVYSTPEETNLPPSGSADSAADGNTSTPTPSPSTSMISSINVSPAASPAASASIIVRNKKIRIKFNINFNELSDLDKSRIKMEIVKMLSELSETGDVYEVMIKSGSLIIEVIFRQAKNTTIVKTFNRIKGYSFNIPLENGKIIKKPLKVEHNLTQQDLRYTGRITTEAECKKENELKEFQNFMSMFSGTPVNQVRGRSKNNIIQYESEGPSNIFSPFLKIS